MYMNQLSTYTSHFLLKESRIHLRHCISAFLMIIATSSLFGQATESRIARQIAEQSIVFQTLSLKQPLIQKQGRTASTVTARALLPEANFFVMNGIALEDILNTKPEFVFMDLPLVGKSSIRMKLQRAEIFSSTFQIFTASDPTTPFPYERGQYYWGVVEGDESSLVALSFTRDEIMGFIQLADQHMTLGKLKDDAGQTHILYKTDDLKEDPGINCFVDDSYDGSIRDIPQDGQRAADNCVRMYIQVDYDIFVNKGGVQQAADYVNGAFSQVAIMYDNESINLVVNEMFVWNVVDPFTGPGTSNYLDQFRSYLNGNFNGDLAHLVGYGGGGGIAYLNVLCNSFNGVGYSGINSTYSNVPTYSWTVMVLTHEIGHNLGSPHTHACAWNGNSTAIDGCGPQAGYSEGCTAPVPPSGTVMSYCHLIGGVGINLLNGFGPQPGDLIRNRVYNSSCLQTCGPPIQFDAGITAITSPISLPCESTVSPVVTLQNFGATTMTSVTISYKLDNGAVQNYAWTGTLTQNQTTSVTLPQISFGVGPHTLLAYTSNPNGQTDEVPGNNQSSKAFTYYLDWCVCNSVTAAITPNPLNHTGSGSSNAGVTLGAGSKRPVFTISGLGSKTGGPQHSRYIDQVVVTYVDGNGVTMTYGTFSGTQQSTVNVSIVDFVNSINVTLSNGLGNNGFSGTLSISFAAVSYCAPGGACPDDDGDGVCNADDQCPGQDDDLIGTPCNDGDPCTENDVYSNTCVCAGTVVPGCPGDCVENTNNFSPNPLTHAGAGQSVSNVSLPAGNSEPNFVISGLTARTSGNPGNRFIEEVTVMYVNGSGNTVVYGVFRGDQVSTVNVNITGVVQSISLTLRDAYDGNSSTLLSVSMTPVTSCNNGGALIDGSDPGIANTLELYPNPTSGELFIRLDAAPKQATVKIYDAIGQLLATSQFSEVRVSRISLSSFGVTGSQLVFVTVEADGKIFDMRHVMVRN